MARAEILTCAGLSKRFGRTTALRSVSFALRAGEFLTVFGHNGAGKSTLLNILASLVRSYEGSLTLFGSDETDEQKRRLIGYVSHESFLYGDLTARENLVFYAKLYGLGDPGAAADEKLTLVGLAEKKNALARELSRGMKQRLSLARAFMHHPRLLLLDEPYTGLDENACRMLGDMLSGFTRTGGTILMATHDVDRGFEASDRVLVLDRGRVVYEARTCEVGLETFRARYREILTR
jgi:heme exporter protein A